MISIYYLVWRRLPFLWWRIVLEMVIKLSFKIL